MTAISKSPSRQRSYFNYAAVIKTLLAVVGVCLIVATTYYKYSWKDLVSERTPILLGGDDGQKCENFNDLADPCTFVKENCQDVAVWINYLEFRYCTLESVNFTLGGIITTVIFAIWLLILLNTLGSTAETFFVPTLTTISRQMNLSPAVAGMTFLALANGAPDIFSTIAGVKSDDMNMVVGALIGAGVCISTMVLGTVIYVSDAHVPKNAFLRNILGYLICMCVVIAFCVSGSISIYQSIAFIAMYVFYVVGSVVYLQVRRCREARRETEDRLALLRAKRGAETLEAPLLADVTSGLEMEADSAASLNSDPAKPPLVRLESELIDTMPEEEEEDEVDHAVFLEGITYPHPEWEGESKPMRVWAHYRYVTEFVFFVLRWISMPSLHIRPDRWGPAKRAMGLFSPIPLAFLVVCDAYAPGDLDDAGLRRVYLGILLTGVAVAALATAYYYLYMLPKVAEFEINRAEARAKVELLNEQNNALDHAVVDALTLEWGLDVPDHEAMPTAVTVFELCAAALAFLGAVSWLSIIADEVVAALQSVGLMLGVSSTLLGLTVLAIANSVGDLISNTTFAKAGHPEVAMGSIFGAPLLITLVGLGASLTITCAQQGGPFVFTMSPQTYLVFGAVLAATVSHIIVFIYYDYRPPRTYGLVLMVSYAIFLCTSAFIELYA